jgi:hypothetical protein
MNKLTVLFKRAKHIYQTEGLTSLLRRGVAFVVSRVFEYRTYYLFEYNLRNRQQVNEADLLPAQGDFTINIVTSSDEMAQLEADGYQFRSYPHGFDDGRALDDGAMAFCVFDGRRLASIGWVATAQKAMDSLVLRHMEIDFSRGCVLAGLSWTGPDYRRMGLHAYRAYKVQHYLADRGKLFIRGYLEKGNIPATKGLTRIGDTVYAEGRYLKILRWKFWKERPLTPD